MHEKGIAYEVRNIMNPQYRDELVERGGKMQVPFLVDTEPGVHMYESGDMIEYLSTHV